MDTLKQRLQRGESVNICSVGRVYHYNLIQMLGVHGGFQGIWFDLEHVGNSIESLEIGAMAARSVGLDSFVRLPPTDYSIVSRSLECGASGIMAAQIRTVEEARQVVQWAKFAPLGNRGMNNGGFDAGFGKLGLADFAKQANEKTLVIIQIETLEAVECCADLAGVPGVDMLFVGPADLSQTLGVPGQFLHEKCVSALERVSAACRQHGKPWGVVPANPDHARLCREKGCKMFSCASDFRLLNAGIQAIKSNYADFF